MKINSNILPFCELCQTAQRSGCTDSTCTTSESGRAATGVVVSGDTAQQHLNTD